MTSGSLHAIPSRIDRVEMMLGSLIYRIESEKYYLLPARLLASAVGQIISLTHSIGRLVRLKTRALYRCIDTRSSWNALVWVDHEAYDEIIFWRKEVRALNDKGLSIEIKDDNVIAAYSDASAVGFGGYVSLCAGPLIEGTEVVGSWSSEEAQQSSSWREAAAVERLLKSNTNVLEHKKVKLFTDNQNVKRILNSGSRQSGLQQIALNIHHFCEQKGITIEPEWIKRSNNKMADALSRTTDSDDWQIQSWVFEYLDKAWGPHSIDRFASNLNTHCRRFNSRWWCPGTEGIDAFSQDWSNDCNWLVPPPRLILRALMKMQKDKAIGTIVVPLWKSSPFWPFVVAEPDIFHSFVTAREVLPDKNVIRKGYGNNGIFAENPLKFNLIALNIVF